MEVAHINGILILPNLPRYVHGLFLGTHSLGDPSKMYMLYLFMKLPRPDNDSRGAMFGQQSMELDRIQLLW